MSDKDQKAEVVARGGHCRIAFTERVMKDTQRWESKDRASLRRILEILAEHGPSDLNSEQFKSEGNFTPKGHHASIPIYAVKSYQKRLYGGFAAGCFYVTCAVVKKKNRADPDKLQAAADRLGYQLGKG